MNTPVRFLPVIAVMMLAACATMFPEPIGIGEPESAVIAKRGQPTHRYQDGKDYLLEYMTGPWGQKTFMARIGPDGKVISFEQVLTAEKFATIKVGAATKKTSCALSAPRQKRLI